MKKTLEMQWIYYIPQVFSAFILLKINEDTSELGSRLKKGAWFGEEFLLLWKTFWQIKSIFQEVGEDYYTVAFSFRYLKTPIQSTFFVILQPTVHLNIYSFIFIKCFLLVGAMLDLNRVQVMLGKIYYWMRRQFIARHSFTPRAHSFTFIFIFMAFGGGHYPERVA